MNAREGLFDSGPLGAALQGFGADTPVADSLARLVEAGLDRIPQPGWGATLQRWQALSMVARHDLSLAKLFEGHTDALAILTELSSAERLPDRIWCMWAAESPQGRTLIVQGPNGEVLLQGAKCWCSGATTATHALLTAWYADGTGPQLVAVALRQPGIKINTAQWQAVGMSASASVDVEFSGASAHLVGTVGSYLQRPGFWQGGAGVAACWYGGTVALAHTLRDTAMETDAARRSGFRLAAIGKVDLALQGTLSLLREGAQWIDDHPLADASTVALRIRLAAEASAERVLREAGRSLGATPFCRDGRFARMAADLPVFVRQSHAERDFEALGRQVLSDATDGWAV